MHDIFHVGALEPGAGIEFVPPSHALLRLECLRIAASQSVALDGPTLTERAEALFSFIVGADRRADMAKLANAVFSAANYAPQYAMPQGMQGRDEAVAFLQFALRSDLEKVFAPLLSEDR